MQCTVHNRQSFLDMAIQECGAFEAAFSLAVRNGLSLTDDLAAGQVLEYIPDDIIKKPVVATLAARGVKPATALTMSQPAATLRGIGFMAVGIDFTVS